MDYREYEVVEDGVTYIVREYTNGAVVKIAKGDGEASPSEPPLDDMTQMQLEMAANIEYLVMLAELNEEV